MKELSLEQKAKLYDEALERYKAKQEYESKEVHKFIEYIFPELKEGKDESIRKCIGDVVREYDWAHIFGITKDDCLSWLEKQGKQMSDPRYSILDKLIEADDIYQMSVNDAMVEEAKNKAIEVLSKLEISKLLWPEKQGLQILANSAKTCKDEQNPAWSEDDGNRINRLIAYFEGKESFTAEDDVVYANWLKSLKDRVQPQPKQEWSEEDRDYYDAIITKLEVTQDDALLTDNQMRFLKSLIPQNRWKPSYEQMNALHDAAVYVDKSMFPYPKGILMKLYKQLKKLREE